jgi:formate hydrogenlyase transcriptional activator
MCNNPEEVFISSTTHTVKHKPVKYTLQKLYNELEKRVDIQTAELAEVNHNLKEEIEKRIQAEENLSKAFLEIKQLKSQLQQGKTDVCKEINLDNDNNEIIGQSEGIKRVLSQAEQVAKTDSTVLLMGETGTGKELIAMAIHNQSSRKNRVMVKVNCAALPSALMESELFGREKGAYTGALTKQIGRFELADDSTLFLDEITELSLELQAKFLRVVQEGEFERLGSSKSLRANVRIIAATNRNLAKAVEMGKFREDLYYRLKVFPILIPPLRDRSEDIPPLVWSFIKKFKTIMGKRVESIHKKSMEALQQYAWPGNIRELRNVIEHAMIISQGKILEIEVPSISDSSPPHAYILEDVERKHIIKVLRKTRWRIYGNNGAAIVLGLKPTTLYSQMKRLGIKRPLNSIDISS